MDQLRIYRQLTTVELQHALAVEIGWSEFDSDKIPALEDIVSACAGLVTVDEQSGIIRLVDYTTQEYFERAWTLWFPNAHLDIANTCIPYLSFDVFEVGFCSSDEEFEARLRQHPLYAYSAQNWGHHGRAQQVDEELSLNFLDNTGKISAAAQALIATKMHTRDRRYS